jgi:hypothetical protein
MDKNDAPINSRATNSNATKPQTERGNQRSSSMGGYAGHGSKASRPEGRGNYGANASPSPSMSDKGGSKTEGVVGSIRDDSAGPVLSHNPYPNGMA